MIYVAPPFEDADKLCDEILAFLIECGGVYGRITAHLQEVILDSIATGQYVLYREDGRIIHWLCYWKVNDVEAIEEGIKPIDTINGNVLYIIEHGNKEGRKGMTRMIKDLRSRAKGMQGVFWNSKGRGIKKFMHQKGD